MQSSFFLRCTVGVAPQLWSFTSQEQQGWPQGKESSSCVAFNWKAIFAKSCWGREGTLQLTGCMVTLLERLGLKSLTAFHDLTNAFGSVKWEAMDRAAAALLGRTIFWDSRDTDWRPPQSREMMETFRSKLVKVD